MKRSANFLFLLLLLNSVCSQAASHGKNSKPVSLPPKSIVENLFYIGMNKIYQRIDLNVPADSAIFIGDSHVQGLSVSAIHPRAVNFGIGGDTTVGVLNRLPYYNSLNSAGVVVLEVGINDLVLRNNQEILNNYSLILTALPKSVRVILTAILPVDERARISYFGWNKRVAKLNILLESQCRARNITLYTIKNACVFLDIGPLLMEEGNLSITYRESDGIHLNGLGYSIWIQNLRGLMGNIHSVELLP
jgi:lysophospholipase L1-like esterase